MNSRNSILFWVILQLAISSVFAILVKFAFMAGVEPMNFSLQILFTSGLWLSVALYLIEGASAFAVGLKDALLLTVVGVVGAGLTFIFCLIGFQNSTTVNYVFINQTSIVFVVLLSRMFLGEKLSRVKFILLFALLAGSYLVAAGGEIITPKKGDLLILLGNFTFSVGVVISKKLMKNMSELAFSTFRSLLGGVSVMAIVIFTGKLSVSINLFWVLLVGSFLALAMYSMNAIINKASASYMIMMSAVSPVITTSLAVFLFGESMNSYQSAGGILIIASMVLIHVGEQRT